MASSALCPPNFFWFPSLYLFIIFLPEVQEYGLHSSLPGTFLKPTHCTAHFNDHRKDAVIWWGWILSPIATASMTSLCLDP